MDAATTTSRQGLWCPQNIHIIGGGLWSRVIGEVLSGLLPGEVSLAMHSTHNASLLKEWAEQRGLANRIQICRDWPDLADYHSASMVLIVANAARDHAHAVERALASRVPVLVEKPIAISSADTCRLMDMAEQNATPIAASHIFLFARYFQHFAARVTSIGAPVQSLTLYWTDPPTEARHGSRKSFDPGLPLHFDVLPHVSSLIAALLPEQTQTCTHLQIQRGGAELQLNLLAGTVPCRVILGRNAERRLRRVEASTTSHQLILDFSTEPGEILVDGQTGNADPEWSTQPRPLATMLRAFLEGIVSGRLDPRLEAASALQGIALAEQADLLYRPAVQTWLANTLPLHTEDQEADLRYALRELFHSGHHIQLPTMEARIDHTLQTMRGAMHNDVIDFITRAS